MSSLARKNAERIIPTMQTMGIMLYIWRIMPMALSGCVAASLLMYEAHPNKMPTAPAPMPLNTFVIKLLTAVVVASMRWLPSHWL